MTGLRKVVIPVAGMGTRVLPASKVVPKELLTIADKPLLQYVIEEAIGAGFDQIILVTHPSKSILQQHFEPNEALESLLETKGKTDLLDSVRNIVPDGVSIESVFQHEPLGLGHAVLCASPLVGDDDFAVSLPDVLIFGPDGRHSHDLRVNAEAFARSKAAQIMVEPVPDDQVNRYGIVDCHGAELKPGQSQRVYAMVEKPDIGSAPSNQSIIGRYILPARIMKILEATTPGVGGEIQLTDAINALIEERPVEACSMFGKTYDSGNKLGYLITNIVFGLDHAEIGADLRHWLKQQEF